MSSEILDTGLTVLSDPADPIADIVFVHGLQGHPRKTWSCKATPDFIDHSSEPMTSSSRGFRHLFSRKQKKDSSENIKTVAAEIFWPRDLLPVDCKDSRIITWGYDSKVSHFFSGPTNRSNISAYARDLLYALGNIRLNCQKRCLLFVAHSLGGIIVKDVLYRAAGEDEPLNNIYTSTEAVLFLGTPHRGSSKAESGETLRKIASVSGFNTNDKNIRALQIDSSELEGIHERFMKLKQRNPWPFEIRTFQEAKGMTGVSFLRLGEKIVDDISSSLDGAEHCQTINANHMSMCRFASKHDDGYQKVVGELQVFSSKVRKALEAEKLEKDIRVSISRAKSPSQATTASSTYSLNDIERLCISLFNASDIAEYKAVLPSRVEGTCQWILTSPQYRYWFSETKTCLLWITGYPGSGKTILSAYLLEYLSANDSPSSFHQTVCFFFCDDKIETQRDGRAILRSLIFQIVTKRRKLIQHIKSAYDIQGTHLVENFNELWRIFTAIVSDKRTGPINVIVDAIDECEETTRTRFLEGIAALIRKAHATTTLSAPCIKFLFTSRPLLGRRYTTNLLQIEDFHKNIEGDLRRVIHSKIEGIVRRTNCRPETRVYLEQVLYSKADQTFLWVTLVLHSLERSYLASQRDFQRIVDDLPQGLAATYERFLHSISAEYQSLASKLLHFIVGSFRPLNLEEVRILLAIEDHHQSVAAVKEDCQPNIRETVEGILGPLIRITDSEVNLVHQSLKEYLHNLSTKTENSLSATYGVDPDNASMLLTKACISYLQLDEFNKDLFSVYQSISEDSSISPVTQTTEVEDVNHSQDPFALAEDTILQDPADIESNACESIAKRYPFFDYSAMHWARHFLLCSAVCSKQLCESVLALSENTSNLNLSWFRYYWLYAGGGLVFPFDFNPFVIVSFFGHLTSVRLLLGGEFPPEQETIASGMYWASRMGHRDIVYHLLRSGALPDSKIVHGQTPLVAAAQFDHLQVVDLLLDEAADVNYRSWQGRTPLSKAASNGHIDIVRRLLDHKRLQPDISDINEWTPLFWAIGSKHLDVVQMLAADKRVDINHIDKQGRNVLSWAAEAGENNLVKYLLTHKDLKAQHKDAKGRTVLSWAAGSGHLKTASILIQSRCTNVSAKDNEGRNAISWACSGGHYTVLDYLIKHDRAGVDEKDENGWTPLTWALNKDSPKTVLTLLASGLVDVNQKDKSGRTPLSWAKGYGYLEVVRILMENGADSDIKNTVGQQRL